MAKDIQKLRCLQQHIKDIPYYDLSDHDPISDPESAPAYLAVECLTQAPPFFNMSVIASFQPKGHSPCASIGCLAGHACVLFGLDSKRDALLAAQVALGLTEDEAQGLFLPELGDWNQYTAADAVVAIDRLINGWSLDLLWEREEA